MQGNTRVKVTQVYYTWHPDFIDHGDSTYETLPTGRWVVEWDIKFANNNYRLHHHTAECSTEKLAQKLAYILNKKHGKLESWTTVAQDDICLLSGKFERIKNKYVITALSGAAEQITPAQS